MDSSELLWLPLVSNSNGNHGGNAQRNGSKGKKKAVTEGVTFRLDKDLTDKLRREAQQKQISTNTLVAQILREHTDWHSNAAKAGFISVRRGTIMKMLDKMTEEDVCHIAKFIAKSDSKDFILMLRSEYNIGSALDVIETWVRISGYPYRHEYRYGKHAYVIQHDMGMKWSVYLRELYKFIFEDFGIVDVNFDLIENTLAFQVSLDA